MSNKSSVIKEKLVNSSRKITIIDHDTFTQTLNQSETTRNIKNTKFKKSQQQFNLSHFIDSKPKRLKSKKQTKPYTLPIYRKKEKKRCVVKLKKQHSTLKKRILKHRQSKTKPPKTEKESNTPKVNEKNASAEVCKKPAAEVYADKPRIHSNKFREYCDNTTSKELCSLVDNLLRELNRFQKRAFQNNEYKARSHPRLVVGLRQVQSRLKTNKIKLAITATDCEKCDTEGGLDRVIATIKEECDENNIPCAFAFTRRQLGYSLFIKSPVSCVGVLDYDGAQDTFFKLIKVLGEEKLNYKVISA